MGNVMVTIISSLLSGLFAVIVSTIYYRRYEKRKMKVDTLKRFAGNRYDLKGDEFSKALNEIFIVFQDSPEVMKALSDYHERVTARQKDLDHLIKLFKAMCKVLNIKFEQFNDSFFLRPFNTRPSCAEQIAK
jgi:hypothetical protein